MPNLRLSVERRNLPNVGIRPIVPQSLFLLAEAGRDRILATARDGFSHPLISCYAKEAEKALYETRLFDAERFLESARTVAATL